jgi:hypothetical protein
LYTTSIQVFNNCYNFLLTIGFVIIVDVAFKESTFTVDAEENYSNIKVHYFFLFFAVLAASLKSCADGAPLAPTLRIFSPEPAAIRLRLAAMLL